MKRGKAWVACGSEVKYIYVNMPIIFVCPFNIDREVCEYIIFISSVVT